MPTPITLHVPRRIRRMPDSPLAIFYRRLETEFAENGHDIQKTNDVFKVPEPDGRFHLCYHTIANRADVLNLKIGYLPGFMLADFAGYSGWAAITGEKPPALDPAPQIADTAFFHQLQRQYVSRRISRYTLREQPDTGHPIPEGSIAIFLQCQDDTVLQLARFSTEQMIQSLIANRNGRPVVIKRHPLCGNPDVTAMLERYVKPEDGIYHSQADVHDILEQAEMVACINSGAGFDALLHAKKVLLFGLSDYRHACVEVTDLSQVATAIEHPGCPPREIRSVLRWYLQGHSLSAYSKRLYADTLRLIEQRQALVMPDPAHWQDFAPSENTSPE